MLKNISQNFVKFLKILPYLTNFSLQLMVCTLVQKFSDYILKYFPYFFQKTGFDISCKLSP